MSLLRKSPAEKKLYDLIGTFHFKKEYKDKLIRAGLTVDDGIEIKNQILEEIENNQINEDEIMARINFLINQRRKINYFPPGITYGPREPPKDPESSHPNYFKKSSVNKTITSPKSVKENNSQLPSEENKFNDTEIIINSDNTNERDLTEEEKRKMEQDRLKDTLLKEIAKETGEGCHFLPIQTLQKNIRVNNGLASLALKELTGVLAIETREETIWKNATLKFKDDVLAINVPKQSFKLEDVAYFDTRRDKGKIIYYVVDKKEEVMIFRT